MLLGNNEKDRGECRTLMLEHVLISRVSCLVSRLVFYYLLRVLLSLSCPSPSRHSHTMQEAFRKVDYDYVMESARIINAAGCDSYHLVSSVGADASSMLLYPRTKGEVWACSSVYHTNTVIAERAGVKRTCSCLLC